MPSPQHTADFTREMVSGILAAIVFALVTQFLVIFCFKKSSKRNHTESTNTKKHKSTKPPDAVAAPASDTVKGPPSRMCNVQGGLLEDDPDLKSSEFSVNDKAGGTGKIPKNLKPAKTHDVVGNKANDQQQLPEANDQQQPPKDDVPMSVALGGIPNGKGSQMALDIGDKNNAVPKPEALTQSVCFKTKES